MSGFLEIIPLIRTLSIKVQHPVSLHPESPQHAVRDSCRGWWLEGCSIVCLLTQQAAFSLHI